MFCSYCNTPFEILPIAEGKNKYCKKCGHLIYKKENNSIIIHAAELIVKPDEELELRERINREKEIRYKEQLERKQKEQEHRVRLEQERSLKEQEEQKRKQQEKEELERLFQLQLEQQKNLQKEKEDQERLLQVQLEAEKNLKEQVLQEQLASEKQERLRLELELADREQKIKTEKDNLEKVKAAAERERFEKEKQLIAEKESVRIQLPSGNEKSKTILIQPTYNNWSRYALPLLAGVLLTLTFFYFKDKISAISKSVKTNKVLASTDTNTSIKQILNTDTALLDQLRTNLIGKEILSWKTIKPNEITSLTILSANNQEDAHQYSVSVDLDDNSNTKATAELDLSYNKIILDKVETTKIIYKNIAPVNAWFSFEPIANCTISINTNNNPIQLKFCDDCSITKIVSTANSPQQIESASNIYIKSDNKYEAVVEFSYVPIHTNQ